jgi:hypothetical protein
MNSKIGEILLRFDEPGGIRSVVLEDDGRVAYGYLLEGDIMVCDVWLYNVGQDPVTVDWRDKSAMPFQNPAKYCGGEVQGRLEADSRVDCSWSENGVTILLNGMAFAYMEKGSKPGWSRAARVDGPLARCLVVR